MTKCPQLPRVSPRLVRSFIFGSTLLLLLLPRPPLAKDTFAIFAANGARRGNDSRDAPAHHLMGTVHVALMLEFPSTFIFI